MDILISFSLVCDHMQHLLDVFHSLHNHHHSGSHQHNDSHLHNDNHHRSDNHPHIHNHLYRFLLLGLVSVHQCLGYHTVMGWRHLHQYHIPKPNPWSLGFHVRIHYTWTICGQVHISLHVQDHIYLHNHWSISVCNDRQLRAYIYCKMILASYLGKHECVQHRIPS